MALRKVYLIEFEWKFNNRNFKGNELEKFLKNALFQEKELEHWKAQSSQQIHMVIFIRSRLSRERF